VVSREGVPSGYSVCALSEWVYEAPGSIHPIRGGYRGDIPYLRYSSGHGGGVSEQGIRYPFRTLHTS
jgi:hypothetical protein